MLPWNINFTRGLRPQVGDGRTPPPQTLELSEARQKQGPMPNAITHNASISAFEKGERPGKGA